MLAGLLTLLLVGLAGLVLRLALAGLGFLLALGLLSAGDDLLKLEDDLVLHPLCIDARIRLLAQSDRDLFHLFNRLCELVGRLLAGQCLVQVARQLRIGFVLVIRIRLVGFFLVARLVIIQTQQIVDRRFLCALRLVLDRRLGTGLFLSVCHSRQYEHAGQGKTKGGEKQRFHTDLHRRSPIRVLNHTQHHSRPR